MNIWVSTVAAVIQQKPDPLPPWKHPSETAKSVHDRIRKKECMDTTIANSKTRFAVLQSLTSQLLSIVPTGESVFCGISMEDARYIGSLNGLDETTFAAINNDRELGVQIASACTPIIEITASRPLSRTTKQNIFDCCKRAGFSMSSLTQDVVLVVIG